MRIHIRKRWLVALTTCAVLMLSITMVACGNSASKSGGNASSSISVAQSEASLPSYQLPEDNFSVAMNEHRDYLTIVNDDHPYEFGGAYDKLLQNDIIYVADCYGEPTPVEKAAYLAFSELRADLFNQGIKIALYSAYRTESDQQWVYDTYANLEGWSETNKVLMPGFSEHHTGLMIEFVVWYNGGDATGEWQWTTVTAERAKDPYYQAIWDTLAKYGFILRYPENSEEITSFPYEPYELRFVGSSAVAKEITNSGITLEEYLK